MMLDLVLVWVFLVFGLNLVDHIHAIAKNFSKGRESLLIQELVICIVDKHLAGAGVCARCGKSNHSTSVALQHWVVVDCLLHPLGSYSWLAWYAKLHHEVGDYAEEASIVQDACLQNVLKTLCPLRSPLRMHADGEALLFSLSLSIKMNMKSCIPRL